MRLYELIEDIKYDSKNMAEDFSWKNPARRYLSLYEGLSEH